MHFLNDGQSDRGVKVADLVEEESDGWILAQLSLSSEATLERGHTGSEEQEGDSVTVAFSRQSRGLNPG